MPQPEPPAPQSGRGDAVSRILRQWQQERPDLDASPMAIIGRLKRCSALLQKRLDETFSRHDLSSQEFDVLATLRRSGAPFCLSPTALFSSLMITSGTMTHRLRRLEASGLVERHPDPQDRRSLLVQLTASGLARIDEAVTAHVANEKNILAPLQEEERAILEQSLTRLLAILEPADTGWPPVT